MKYDLTQGLKVCTKPKLFIAGAKDVLVLPNVVKEGFSLAAEPKMFREVDQGHDYRRDAEGINIVNKIIGEFLSTYTD